MIKFLTIECDITASLKRKLFQKIWKRVDLLFWKVSQGPEFVFCWIFQSSCKRNSGFPPNFFFLLRWGREDFASPTRLCTSRPIDDQYHSWQISWSYDKAVIVLPTRWLPKDLTQNFQQLFLIYQVGSLVLKAEKCSEFHGLKHEFIHFLQDRWPKQHLPVTMFFERESTLEILRHNMNPQIHKCLWLAFLSDVTSLCCMLAQ